MRACLERIEERESIVGAWAYYDPEQALGDAVFNRPWTMLHAPCVTLPGFRGPRGLPVGIQIVGPRNADRQLLAAACWMGGQRLADG